MNTLDFIGKLTMYFTSKGFSVGSRIDDDRFTIHLNNSKGLSVVRLVQTTNQTEMFIGCGKYCTSIRRQLDVTKLDANVICKNIEKLYNIIECSLGYADKYVSAIILREFIELSLEADPFSVDISDSLDDAIPSTPITDFPMILKEALTNLRSYGSKVKTVVINGVRLMLEPDGK